MDMNQLMQQAKELQSKVAEAQDKLGTMSVKGIAGGGMAITEMSGKYDLLGLTLNPDLLKEDVSTIQTVIMASFNDAKSKADALIDKVMSSATAGIDMPQ
jgi:DNA-binding YbaB/EbfC family protein